MKRKIGDRKDATLIRNTDSMHFIMGIIYPNRADNEAFIRQTIDLTNADKFLEKMNATNPEYKYNTFQLIVAAYLKCIVLREKLNRFYQDGNYYQRNYISGSFVIKKKFEDKSEEGLAFVNVDKESTLEQVRESMFNQINSVRNGKDDSTTENMNDFNKMPRWLSKTLVKIIVKLDKKGKVPLSLIKDDPNYSSIFFTNLGSIKLDAGYHHLTNWGTCSLFCVVGKICPRPFYNEDGTYEMRNSVEIGLTADERIADGYYFSRTVQLFKYLLDNPELLLEPFKTEVDF